MLADGVCAQWARLVVVGDRRVLELGQQIAGVELAVQTAASPLEARWDNEAVPIVDMNNIDPCEVPQGGVSPKAGRAAGETLVHMTELAQAGELDAITFAPLHKKALYSGGFEYVDEHAMFADLTGWEDYYSEVNVIGDLWACSVTTHIPFRDIMTQLDEQAIFDTIVLVHETRQRFGTPDPRILVSALNPHAGDEGLHGDEEQTMIEPAIERACELGIRAEGPYPADTIFRKAFAEDCDAVVSMYHDQGRVATKLKGFLKGVTITAGLPVVYTTPAHGTAYDIVGTGTADTGALVEAVRLAARLARRPIT
jgi:4-hydroxythreonine-4-phosphate dehydrogenase